MAPQTFIPHTPLTMELSKTYPSKQKFQVFIRPENIADSIEKSYNRSSISYIPNINNTSNNIYLFHDTRYSIGILNQSCNDCNADIFIDGAHIGTFRILKNTSSFQLKRPIECNKSFNFISKNSEHAIITGMASDENPNLGEIRIEIRPRDTSYSRQQSTIYAAASANTGLKVECDYGSASAEFENKTKTHDTHDIADGGESTQLDDSGYSEGLTVLGSHTNQSFKHAPYMPTLGMHTFLYKLVVGDPEHNTIFYINN